MIVRLAALLILAAPTFAGDGNVAKGDPQDRFGRTFASAFDALRKADPIDPKPGDAGKSRLTGDPVDF